MDESAPVLEVARIRILPGCGAAFEAALREAAPLLCASPGFLGAELRVPMEAPGEYRLVVRWRSVEDHVRGFQGSPAFREWRRLLGPWFDGTPDVEHLIAPVLFSPSF